MTYEEAIKILRDAEFLTHHDADYSIDVVEAIDIAADALEKQIERKEIQEKIKKLEQEQFDIGVSSDFLTFEQHERIGEIVNEIIELKKNLEEMN